MNEIYNQITAAEISSIFVPPLLGGLLLGTVFFLGLWWTVRKGTYARYPAIWFFSSFLLRTSITLLGIYLLTDGQLPKLLACIFGFICARIVVIRMTRPLTRPVEKQESSHAP